MLKSFIHEWSMASLVRMFVCLLVMCAQFSHTTDARLLLCAWPTSFLCITISSLISNIKQRELVHYQMSHSDNRWSVSALDWNHEPGTHMIKLLLKVYGETKFNL